MIAEKFKSDLMKIAMTTLSSKILSQDKEHFAKLAVDAVMRLKVIGYLSFSSFGLEIWCVGFQLYFCRNCIRNLYIILPVTCDVTKVKY